MRLFAKYLCVAAAFTLLLTGCQTKEPASSDTESTTTFAAAASTTGAQTTQTESTALSQATTSTTRGGIFGGDNDDDPGQTKEESQKLPALFSISEAELKSSVITSTMKVSFSKDAKHLPKGANKAIKMSVNNSNWGQLLCFKSVGGKETTIVDPCPDPLSDYDGLRMWVDLQPAEAGAALPEEIVIILGNWTYGYRDMFEFHYKVPKGGVKDYITMPFAEMINAYEPHDKYYNADLIDFIGIKIAGEATLKNVDLYIADLSAYSEVFW